MNNCRKQAFTLIDRSAVSLSPSSDEGSLKQLPPVAVLSWRPARRAGTNEQEPDFQQPRVKASVATHRVSRIDSPLRAPQKPVSFCCLPALLKLNQNGAAAVPPANAVHFPRKCTGESRAAKKLTKLSFQPQEPSGRRNPYNDQAKCSIGRRRE